jgi:type IV pilus assembly protein PilO
MTGSLESFHDEQLMAPPAGPPVLLGVELTPIRIGLLIGILGVGMAGFLAFTQLRPLIEEVQALEREVAQKTSQLQEVQGQIASLQDLPNQIERARGQQQQLSALFATPENADTQLIDLNRLVQGQPNSQLLSFSPSPLTPASSDNPEVPAIIAPAIQVQTTRVTVQGPYADIINLMRDIERFRALFRVGNLSLNPVQGRGELNVAFDLTAYYYNKDIPLGTAPAPEGQPSPAPEQPAPTQSEPEQPAPGQ